MRQWQLTVSKLVSCVQQTPLLLQCTEIMLPGPEKRELVRLLSLSNAAAGWRKRAVEAFPFASNCSAESPRSPVSPVLSMSSSHPVDEASDNCAGSDWSSPELFQTMWCL